MAEARDSATVVLTRGRGAELEVYLVLRSRRLSFFAGSWAFPGGTVDDEDRLDAQGGEEQVLRRCALRELFEETGVLVPTPGAPLPAEREAWREILLAGGPQPPGWRACVDGGAAARLTPVGTVVTPPFGPRRYRAAFFHLDLPEAEPRVLPGELEEGRFFRLDEVFALWRSGAAHFVPPVLYLLDGLRGVPLEEGLARAAAECRAIAAGKLHAAHPVPGVLVAPLRTPTLPPAWTTNAYVVGEERAYVVDPATYEEEERERLCRELDARRAAGTELAGVLLTHHHADHVGSALPVARRYGLPLLAHPLTQERVPGDFPSRVPLLDGARLPLGRSPDGAPGWTLAAHHTPGHAPGHLVFVESRYGAAVCGDLVSTVSTIVIDPEDGHLSTYLASLERVLALGIGPLLPAHGGAFQDGPELLRRYLAHRARREEALLLALERGPATPEELVPVVYDDTPPAAHGLALRSLLSGLEKLAEEGRAGAAGGRWSLAS